MGYKSFYARHVKRALDILIALLGLLIASPLLLLTAIAVKLDSKGPAIFKQPRLGLNGRVFNIYKFRSMTNKRDNNGELLH